MKSNIINAEQASKLSFKSGERLVPIALLEIEPIIKEAAQKGLYNVTIEGELLPAVWVALENLGYDLYEEKDDDDRPTVFLTWPEN